MGEKTVEVACKQRFIQAAEVIKEAGHLALDYFRNREQLQIETKSEPQDVVSIADRNVEELIRERLLSAFSGDGFLGEEQGLVKGSSDWTWVVDPIDGTSCFLTGMHAWCISIALMHGDEPVAGLIFDPNAGELFSARKNHGCSVDGKPAFCLDADSLKNGLMGLGTSHRVPPEPCSQFIQKLLEEGGMFIRNGSGALMLAYVAAGRLLGYYEPHINAWDCLAGIVLVKEAGGVVNDFLAGEGLLNGNPILVCGANVKSDLESLTGISLA